jgi:polyisoprenyl-phosphate glycosyltransferase
VRYESDMDGLKLSVVVPCYNEAGGILELHQRVSLACQALVGHSYELVLVNDGSSDLTWKIMRGICATDSHVVAINLSRNYGHQLALSAGLKMSRGARVFILDADLQDPPELLPEMMMRLDEGYDVAFGVRIERQGESFFKKASAHFFYRILDRLVDIDIPPDTGDFRLMSRRAVDILNDMPEQDRFIRGMVSWIGLRQAGVPYERSGRFAGNSHYTIGQMIRLAVDAITGFSTRPLRIASYVGLSCSVATFLLLMYIVLQHFAGRTVQGWTSLAVIILGLGSIQMLIIGIIGEYLGRLYMEAKKRPLYLIQEVVASPVLATAPETALRDT